LTRGCQTNAGADARIEDSEAHGEVRLAILPYGRRFMGGLGIRPTSEYVRYGKRDPTGMPGDPVVRLDLSETAVRRWAQQAAVDAGRGGTGALTTAEREELVRLRRENRTLAMEREILRKAAAFFAKESV